MGLTNIEEWRAAHGFDSGAAGFGPGGTGPEEGNPALPGASAALDHEIDRLNAEIARQASLIVQLQAALRRYVEAEERVRAEALARSRQPARGRVIRRSRAVAAALPSPR